MNQPARVIRVRLVTDVVLEIPSKRDKIISVIGYRFVDQSIQGLGKLADWLWNASLPATPIGAKFKLDFSPSIRMASTAPIVSDRGFNTPPTIQRMEIN